MKRWRKGSSSVPAQEARMSMTDRMDQLATESSWDFSGLKALFINCTLKKSPERLLREGRWVPHHRQ